MPRLKTLLLKMLLLGGVFFLFLYAIFRAFYINLSPALAVFSIILFIAELHTLILALGMFYSLWPRKHQTYENENTNRNLQINVFITVAGEPFDIVQSTILHAKKAAEYYKKTVHPYRTPRVIVLNDGKAAKKEGWKDIAEYCKKLGVYHIARETNEGYKAGNINNGIHTFALDDPKNTIDCFLDADFCAKEYFITEILKPLANATIDFVQTPQRYRNLNTWVAEASGSHQIFFFDYICPAKSYDNALFLCGTNYAIRRKALLNAGGVDNRFVTEDYATSIKLHLQGNRGVYLPTVLALGLAPMNLKEYFNQQTRWCKGCLDANGQYFKKLFFGRLTLKQKFHYFLSTAYYFVGIRDLILILAPIPYLFFGISLIRANTLLYLTFIYLPFMLYSFALYIITFRNPVKSLVLTIVSFPVFASAFLSSIFKITIPFTITIKKYERENPFKVYGVQLLVMAVLTAGIIYSFVTKSQTNMYGRYINYFWSLYDVLFLLLGFLLVVKENYAFSFMVTMPKTLKKNQYLIKRALLTTIPLIFLLFVQITLTHEGRNITTYVQAATNTLTQTPKQTLIVPQHGVYYGYYLPTLNTHPKKPVVSINTNEKVSIAMFYQDWTKERPFDTNYMNVLSVQNVIPMITWEPWDATDQTNINQPAYSPKIIAAGTYDDFIRSFAREAALFKKPFFLRFAHEMNGNWYPWGDLSETSAKDYKNMWIHVHTIFVQEGATNVIWVWSPNNTDVHGETDSVMSFYPGNAYVDWVSYSGFNWGNTKMSSWMSFKDLSHDIYTVLVKTNKPIMVAETATVGNNKEKEDWFAKAIADMPLMPQIKAVVIYGDNYKQSNFKLSQEVAQSIWSVRIATNKYFIKTPLILRQAQESNNLLGQVFKSRKRT